MAATSQPPPTDMLTALAGSAARRRREAFVSVVLMSAAVLSIAVTLGIVVTVLFEALQFLGQIDISQLFTIGWFPRRGQFDIATILIGSILVTVIAMALAIPIGLLSAIYLAEYAKPRVRRVVKPILEILAGIPSVVLGFFALTVITPELIKTFFPEAGAFNLLAAGIGVGILSIPLVASVSEDAMRAVPQNLREASYGLGAKPLTTALRIVFPAAISGIVAAIILATSRAIGETMVVAVAGGTPQLRSWDPLHPGGTMTSAMVQLATGSDQVAGDDAAYLSLFFVGLLLFLITLGLNILGDVYVQRTRARY